MELTPKDRLFLTNQFKILQQLIPAESKYYEDACKVLEHGYAFEYDHLFGGFSRELSIDDCKEVIDILEMYRSLDVTYRKLADKAGINERGIKFHGFDGNHETAQLGYAEFLIHDQGKWEEHRQMDLNSHWPALERYRPMLREWKVSQDRYNLTKDDITRIIAG